MDTSEGIKTDHTDMESILKFHVQIKQHFEIMSFHCKMVKLKNAPTDPLFLNESGSALSRANYLFHINKFYRLQFDFTGFGLVFPGALISYCGQ